MSSELEAGEVFKPSEVEQAIRSIPTRRRHGRYPNGYPRYRSRNCDEYREDILKALDELRRVD